jgi:NADH-quinone oxidoreductase subunit L
MLFIGAMGKSAQILLHTWLPDAMEGPTPVSALIHAATMVTAGVFLVVRCSPIFEYSEVALKVVASIGMLTAFFAATVALVQNDIKKIIAYSTCSQLGYMFFAAGVGAYHVATFHLFTHAFFKALLFLGSGCVIHSFKEEQDIRFMGGVWKKIPYTYILMITGTLALTGFPFLSGYYSKDAIIEFAYLKGTFIGNLAVIIGISTALLTAIYSWRLIFKTFHGKYNNKENNFKSIHESKAIMLIPSLFLAIGAIFSGYLFKDIFIGSKSLEFWNNSILFTRAIYSIHPPTWLIVMTPILVTLMIPVSYYLFVKNDKILKNFILKNRFIYNFLLNKWYFDELYELIFVSPLKKIGVFLWKKGDIDTIDKYGPNGFSKLIKIISNRAVNFQSGYLYHYAFVMLIGFSILLTYLIIY